MAIQIKLKNSVVQDSTPSTSDLPAVGEIALNANINSIGGFMRASDNSIVKIFGPGSLSTPTATTTVSGISELATNSETTTGTATNRVVTPAGLNAVTVAERSTSNSTYLALAGGTLTGVVAATAGSNSAPSIHFGDSDSGIFGGTNTVSLAAGGTTRLTADTGVSVVGTLAVTGAITSTDDLTIPDKIIHSGDTNTAIRFPAADTVSVETGGSEALRVDSSQHLLVGHTSSLFSMALGVAGTDGGGSGISSSRFSNNTSPATVLLSKSRGATVGSYTVLQDNDQVGVIDFRGSDGTDNNPKVAEIMALIDGTPGSNDMPGRLEFKTTADGSDSTTTRLTIDSAGLVKIPDNGKFVAGAGNDLQIYHDGTHSYIENSTGSLINFADTFLVNKSDNSENILRGFADGAVELYYNGTKKFETTANGADFTVASGGQVNIFGLGSDNGLRISGPQSASSACLFFNTNHQNVSGGTDQYTIQCGGANHTLMFKHTDTTGNVVFELDDTEHVRIPQDNKALKIGAGQDLRLLHDGNNSFLTNTSTGGFLHIRSGSGINLQDEGGNENFLKCIDDGAVELYHDNNKKLETKSDGIDVTGEVQCDSLDVDGGFNIDGSQITYDASSNVMKFTDDAQLRFGSGNDLRIYHNGTSNIIQAASNDLNIRMVSSENAIVARQNGAAELYYDNSKKFETTSSGVTVSGDTSTGSILQGVTRFCPSGSTTVKVMWDEGGFSSAGHFQVKDGVAFTVGDSSDLKIYHDGSNSRLKNTTGSLWLQSDNGIRFVDADVNESMAAFYDNGAVELYYDNSKKFETKSSGAQITGQLQFSDGSGSAGSNMLSLGNSDDLKIYHDGSHSYIANSTNNLYVNAPNFVQLGVSNGGEKYLTATENGAVELYYDNSKKFETRSGGLGVFGHIEAGDNNKLMLGDSNDLQIYHDGTDSYIRSHVTGAIYNRARTHWQVSVNATDGGADDAIKAIQNAQVALYYDHSQKLETTSTGIAVTGNSNTFSAGANALNTTFSSAFGGAGATSVIRVAMNTSANLGLQIQQNGSGTSVSGGNHASSIFNREDARLRLGTDNTEQFRIEANGDLLANDTSIGSLSDSRLKKNIVDFTYDLSKFKQFKARTFDWINPKLHGNKSGVRGFIAQEIEVIDNTLVGTSELFDETLTDKNPDLAIIEADDGTNIAKDSKLGTNDAMYISVIQQMLTKIETLEVKVAALEAA